jgi:hypothetical protein
MPDDATARGIGLFRARVMRDDDATRCSSRDALVLDDWEKFRTLIYAYAPARYGRLTIPRDVIVASNAQPRNPRRKDDAPCRRAGTA